jgi:O-antigen/teichoic acid export membrane protein
MLVIATFLINSALNFALGLVLASVLGPTHFGQYAIAASLAIVLNVIFLDWIRVAATRFYSNASRSEDPEVRNTLDSLFLVFSLLLLVIAAIGILAGLDFGLMTGLAACAPIMAICNGLFDYNAALARARFEERIFSLLVGTKNLLSFALMVGGAWWFQSPLVVAIGFILSSLGTVLLLFHRLRDKGSILALPDIAKSRLFFRYGFPVVASVLIYFLIPFFNRTTIAHQLGFAASGQFSLAYDTTLKLAQTIASAMDVLLFQLAVHKAHEGEADAARAQVLRNIGIVFAIMAVSCTGYWLILPSFEALLVPRAYHGSFRELSTLLLPGIFCFALIQAAATPVLQLKSRTWPVVLAAILGFMINMLVLNSGLMMGGIGGFAVAQTIGYSAAAAAAFLVALSVVKGWPSLRDLLIGLGTCAALATALWPIRAMPPGILTLTLSLAVGGAVVLILFWMFNLADLKTLVRARLAARGQRNSGQ